MRKIRDSYSEIKLSDEAKERIIAALREECANIAAEREEQMKGKHIKRKPAGRIIAIAAAAALVVALGTAAYAADWLGLRGLRLDSTVFDDLAEDAPPAEETNGNVMTEYDMISLQGMMGSVEYAAASEWNEYVRQYLQNNQIDNYYRVEDRYLCYQAYSDEMATKLDEICEKYSLSLHGDMECVSQGRADEEAAFFACIGADSVIDGGKNFDRYDGYYYSEGGFRLDTGYFLQGERIIVQLGRNMKGVMDDVTLNVANIDGDEWVYVTSDGVTLGIAMGDGHAVIYADGEKAFVTVNVLSYVRGDPPEGRGPVLTREFLEELAEHINFEALA